MSVWIHVNTDVLTDTALSGSIQSWFQPAQDLYQVQSDSVGLSEPGNFPRLLNSVGKDLFT